MITPSPQVNKTFEPPLAARPISIRTGSLSPTPPPARSRVRTVRLRQATSTLGMRSRQGISHLRSLTLPQKARDRSGSNTGSSRSAGSRKGTRDRPLVIGWPKLLDGESAKAVLERPVMTYQADNDRTPASLPVSVLVPRASAICAQFPDTTELDKLRAPMLAPTAEVESPEEYVDSDSRTAKSTRSASEGSTKSNGADCSSAKRVGGVELWENLEIDRDALRDALEDHPNPLSSNPTSEHDDEEPTTPWTTCSSTAEKPEATEANASYWQPSPSPSPAPRRRPRSITLAAASAYRCSAEPISPPSSQLSRDNSTLSKPPCTCDTIPRLRNQLTNLSAYNSALLALKAAHEETIAILRNNLRNQDAAISRQENTIADLQWQVQAKETEQVTLIENLCAEIASESREIAQLGEDKWYLMGRVEELELKVATIEDPVVHDEQEFEKRREENVEGSPPPTTAEDIAAQDSLDDAGDERSIRLVGSSLSIPNSPTSNLATSIKDGNETQTTVLSSPSSPRSNGSLCAVTPSPRRHSNQIHLATALDMRDGSIVTEQRGRYPRNGPKAAARAVLAATVILEQRFAGSQEKLATSEASNLELKTQLACQAKLIQQLTSTSAAQILTSSAHIPIPDLPILKYTTSASVWLDRVRSSFAYLGLLDFIQRDVPQPEISTWDATEVTDWTSRRMRAVVLLKQAVDDSILEDVLYLQSKNQTPPGERDLIQSNSTTDDPHQLLSTITSLRRIISDTATDLGWLDRIQSTDYQGIESFTSLVLCVDRRHGVMYGTSTDHYDALLPKLQETMTRLFPEMKGSMFAEDTENGLRKWRQLPVWMAKVVKRRQTT